VPIVVAAGVDGKAPHISNGMVKTGLKRGKLSRFWRYVNPVLNGRTELPKCVETIDPAPLRQGGEIVRSLAKVRLLDIMFARHTQGIHRLVYII